MERYDCKVCGENVFEVQGIEHLGSLPRTLTCSGCGTRYTAQLNKEGKLWVYKGEVRKPKPAKPKPVVEGLPLTTATSKPKKGKKRK